MHEAQPGDAGQDGIKDGNGFGALEGEQRAIVGAGQRGATGEMAGDMRAMVRQRIAAGEKPEQIRAWLIERYGNWVSYDPPLEPITWPLWAAPILLILAGLFLARGRFRRKKS